MPEGQGMKCLKQTIKKYWFQIFSDYNDFKLVIFINLGQLPKTTFMMQYLRGGLKVQIQP